MKAIKSILPVAAASFAGALSLTAPQEANAQATVCIGNVCQIGKSSVSVGPTSVYSNGRDTYVNGQRVDPRNPNPLTNPGWRPSQPPAQKSYPSTRPSYNSSYNYTAQTRTVNLPETTSDLTCKLGIAMTTSFTTSSSNDVKALNYSDMMFASVDDLRNMRSVLMQYGYLTPQALPDKCGPKTGEALQQLLDKNPNLVIISKDAEGNGGVFLDLDLDRRFDPRIDAQLNYNF